MYISDQKIAAKINLNSSDFAYIYSLNESERALYPAERHRHDIWRIFVREKLFPHLLNIEENLVTSRFKIGEPESQHIRKLIVMCDLSEVCLQFWTALDKEVQPEHNKYNISKLIKQGDTIKNIKLIEIFYHMKILKASLPLLMVIDGEDPSKAYLPLRYLKNLKVENPYFQIEEYLQDIENGRASKIVLSSGIPQKNGFYGKGAQKKVQKLSYDTYTQAINKANAAGVYYLLFVTAFDFDCKQCDEYYKDYKKLASFLSAQERKDIQLGVIDLSQNQIAEKYLDSIPNLLLYCPGQSKPIKYNKKYDFESTLIFLKANVKSNTSSDQM